MNISDEAVEAAVRTQVFNGRYHDGPSWHDGWVVRVPYKFDRVFLTHAEAIQYAANEDK